MGLLDTQDKRLGQRLISNLQRVEILSRRMAATLEALESVTKRNLLLHLRYQDASTSAPRITGTD
jgi:hypothetical protein